MKQSSVRIQDNKREGLGGKIKGGLERYFKVLRD